MSDLTSLIERIEAATEGSRELDALIGVAIGRFKAHPSKFGFDEFDYADLLNNTYPGHGGYQLVPHYSTSIDAVMSLRPDGLVIRSTLIAEGLLQIHEAWFCRPDNDHLDGEIVIDGYTEPKPPALALLAAILRARQTEGR